MGGTDRRTFLMTSATALSGAALGGCTPAADAGTRPALEPALLRALGDAILPGELGAGGRETVAAEFEAWLAGYDPVPELDHGYGTSEIRYGPADPAPGWAAQLRGLDLEARKRHGAGFAELAAEARRDLVRSQLAGAPERLPDPVRAPHVALGLLSFFYASSRATDLCYGAAVGRVTCRGIASAPEAPRPLDGVEGAGAPAGRRT